MTIWKYGVGLGQGGYNIVSTMLYKLVERICKVDYDIRDYLKVEGDSIVLDKNGSGGDSNKGSLYFEEVVDKLETYICKNIKAIDDRLLVCAGGGNGSGDGSIIPFIKICEGLGVKPFVVFTLPKSDEGLITKKHALYRLVEIVNNYQESISGLLVIDNEYIKSELNTKGKFFTNFDMINQVLLDSFLFFSDTTKNKSSEYIDSYKVFDYNDLISLISDGGIINIYKIELDSIDINDVEEYVKKNIGKSSIFSSNMNLNTVRSGVALVEVPEGFSQRLMESYLEKIYKGLGNRFRLSKKFIFTAIKSEHLRLNLLATGMTLTQKISVDATKLETDAKRFKNKVQADKKVEVNLNIDI